MVNRTAVTADEKSEESEASTPIPASPGNKLVAGIKALEKLMKELQYSLHKGEVYRKVPEGKFTFVKCCSVGEFVHATFTNGRIADIIAPQVTNIISFLSHPGCQIIPPLKFDYNLIEVKPKGVSFNIAEKQFVPDAITQEKLGLVSPRVYIGYTYKDGKFPDPKVFREVIENSFTDEETMIHFLRRCYQLLCHGKFPLKTKSMPCW